jgi:hypothetical protein
MCAADAAPANVGKKVRRVISNQKASMINYDIAMASSKRFHRPAQG